MRKNEGKMPEISISKKVNSALVNIQLEFAHTIHF